MKGFLVQTGKDESKLPDVNRAPKLQSLKDIRGLAKWKDPEMVGEWNEELGWRRYRGVEQNPDSNDILICYLPVMVEFTRKL